MRGLIDRLVLITLPILICIKALENKTVYVALVSIIIMSFLFFFSNSKLHLYLFILTGLLIILFDEFLLLVILLVYEAVVAMYTQNKKELYCLFALCIVYILTGISTTKSFFICLQEDLILASTFVVLLFVAAYLGYSVYRNEKNEHDIRQMRDDNQEFRLMTEQKSELIRKQQDNEITVVTLKERNRIAREIHDNVGHLLSRCILQMGALQALYKEEPLASGLKQINATLNESMTSIRNSVHDLYNEAFDLKKSIKDIIDKQDRFKIHFDYDIGNNISKEVKYCFLSIVQESVNNAIRHSNGEHMDISVYEHPAFYQLSISDDGKDARISETGIGLHNMESRVQELNGSISFQTEKGFKIFLTIPKKVEEKV